jgi:hypothetical protein
MSKSKSKKKVTVGKKREVTATTSRRIRTSSISTQPETLLFEKTNFTFVIGGAILVFFGMMMMLGGGMPDPNTWDPDIIYSSRITVVGPVLIIAGLVLEIYAIFKK